MVLTNFECWAHGGGINGSVINTDSALEPNDIETMRRNNRGVDLFNPRSVSQISSNGYYGFSHINPAMNTVSQNVEQDQQEDNNNNNNHNHNNNNNNQLTENDANAGSVGGAVRCKKRFFVGDMEIDNFFSDASNTGSAVAAKRCRYDDADMAAQYCNDFFSLPVTQIGTQSCLMDIEVQQQEQQCQQQVHNVDEAMTIGQIQNAQQNAAINHSQLQMQTQQPHDLQQQQHQHHHNQHYQDQQTLTVRKKQATKENCVKHIQKKPMPAWPDDTEADSPAAANAADDMFMSMHGGSLQQFVLQSLNAHKDNDNFYADI